MTTVLCLLGLIAALAAFTAVEARRIEGRYPPTGQRIPVGGGAIHALYHPAEGEERGAVMLVHGASGNAADLFAALAERLSAQGFRVLSLDRPGHGWSDRVGGDAVSCPVVQAAALRRAAEALGVSEAVLPLALRPLHFSANCEDVAHAEAAVAALSPRYGAIRAPTEVVTGDSDGVVSAPIHSAGLARDIPGARLTTLEGVGHSPHHVAPEPIVEIIIEAERRASERETKAA